MGRGTHMVEGENLLLQVDFELPEIFHATPMFIHIQLSTKHTIYRHCRSIFLMFIKYFRNYSSARKAKVMSQWQEEKAMEEESRVRRRKSRREDQEVKNSINNNHFILTSLYFHILCR